MDDRKYDNGHFIIQRPALSLCLCRDMSMTATSLGITPFGESCDRTHVSLYHTKYDDDAVRAQNTEEDSCLFYDGASDDDFVTSDSAMELWRRSVLLCSLTTPNSPGGSSKILFRTPTSNCMNLIRYWLTLLS